MNIDETVKEQEKIHYACANLRKFKQLCIKIKVHFRKRNSTSNKEGHYILEKGLTHQKDITLTAYYTYSIIEF